MGIPYEDDEEYEDLEEGAEEEVYEESEDEYAAEGEMPEEEGLLGGGGLSQILGLPEWGADIGSPVDSAMENSETDLSAALSEQEPIDEFEEMGFDGGEEPLMSGMGGEEELQSMQTEDPEDQIKLKEQLMGFLESEAKARRERAESFQKRAREYMKYGGQR